MKKIKMLTSMAGPRESWVPGDIRDVEDEVAEAWKARGFCEIIETATVEQKETAVKRRGRPKGR